MILPNPANLPSKIAQPKAHPIHNPRILENQPTTKALGKNV